MQTGLSFERASVVKNTALMLACVLMAGLGIRAVVAGAIEPVATTIGSVCALLLLYLYRQMSRGVSAEVGGLLVVGVTIVLYTSLSWTSDGFQGSVIFAAPMVPLIASLMLTARGTRNVTVIMAAILLFMLTQHLTGRINPDKGFPEEIRFSMRAIIMLLSLVGVNWIISYYLAVRGGDDSTAASGNGLDPLTGLLSREMMEQALEREFARARRAQSQLSLALIELDDFSELEDEHGIHAAENCLIGVADGLRYSMRRSSDALGCFDSRRLVILMSDTDSRGARRVAEKFRQLIETLDIPLNDTSTINATVSVGVCTAPARGDASAGKLVVEAEQAMFTARAHGGNLIEVVDLGEHAGQAL
jgi:diguanylate cyclase (GGDEF)-like protein